MSVHIPTLRPDLPDIGDFQVNQLVKGSTLQSLAAYGNHLEGWWMRRCTPIIVRPFDMAEDQTIHAAVQMQWVPLRVASFTQHIFLGFGVSNVETDAYIQAEVRVEPVEDGTGNATPGSGALTDPGCKWREVNGDLINPVRNGRYQIWGLQWARTGLAVPADASPADPIADIPRVLHVVPDTSQELVLRWDKVAVNNITVWEMFRAEV